MRISALYLAPADKQASYESALSDIVRLAQRAEARGLERVWYAEHHNMAAIASSATSVLIAHVAAHTSTIRLGSGGVMLPNHSPLVIAEQFGTLAALHPNRIDVGLGRAPGTDQKTFLALRRDPQASERFPSDVVELQSFLAGGEPIPGVKAAPVAQTPPPLYILGSSLFGATLAAQYFPGEAVFPIMCGTIFQQVLAATFGRTIERICSEDTSERDRKIGIAKALVSRHRQQRR